jgi:hypothetical protein
MGKQKARDCCDFERILKLKTMLIFSIVILCLKSIGVFIEMLLAKDKHDTVARFFGDIVGKILLIVAMQIAAWQLYYLI